MPRYLAKSGLFKNRALGYFLSAAGQIPVERLSKNAEGAFDAAVAAVATGECVVVYPEGTLTRDPDLWPMAGKSGAARIALETGCPVIPVGQWGAQELLCALRQEARTSFPRKQITMKVGDPVTSRRPARRSRAPPEVVNEATDRIMDALTALVAEIRGEAAAGRAVRPAQGRRARRPATRTRPSRAEERSDHEHAARSPCFGAGSWGTAFSLVLADAGNDVTLWARREEVCDAINRAAREHRLPARHRAAADGRGDPRRRGGAGRRRRGRASPCRRRRCARNLDRVGAVHRRTAPCIVSLMKGVELGTLKRMSEVIAEVTGAGPERIAVVSGPNLVPRDRPARAGRLGRRLRRRGRRQAAAGPRPLAGVPALHQHRRASAASSAAPTRTSSASRSAWRSASGFGDNTTASVITRGLAETARLAMALGANPLTLMGLAGLGDLVATCSSPLSRNRTFGEKLGQGMTTEEIVASTRQVAEGAKSCSSLLALAERRPASTRRSPSTSTPSSPAG